MKLTISWTNYDQTAELRAHVRHRRFISTCRVTDTLVYIDNACVTQAPSAAVTCWFFVLLVRDTDVLHQVPGITSRTRCQLRARCRVSVLYFSGTECLRWSHAPHTSSATTSSTVFIDLRYRVVSTDYGLTGKHERMMEVYWFLRLFEPGVKISLSWVFGRSIDRSKTA